MKQPPILLFALVFLVLGAGCIELRDTDTPENATSPGPPL
jgi:hypothetical protein